MSSIQMAIWYSHHHFNTGLVFKWWPEYQTKYRLVFRWHLNTGPFGDSTTFDQLNTKPDLHYIKDIVSFRTKTDQYSNDPLARDVPSKQIHVI